MTHRVASAILLLAIAGCGQRDEHFRFADTAAGRHLAELLPPPRTQSWPVAPLVTAPQPRRSSAIDRVTLLPPSTLPSRTALRLTWARLEPQNVSREIVAIAEFPARDRVALPVGPLAHAPTLDPALLPPLPATPMSGEPKPAGRDDPTRDRSRELRLTAPVAGRTNVPPVSASLSDPEANQRDIQLRRPPGDNDPPAP